MSSRPLLVSCGLLPWLLAATVACAQETPTHSKAAPSQLPKAERQVPKFEAYRGRQLKAGESYKDPATGVRITKLTDATTPEANESGTHHYASGPAQISREWGNGQHTINVQAAGKDYLVDYKRGGGLTNWRVAEFTGADLSFGLSFRTNTPRIGYAVRDMVLRQYDTSTMSETKEGPFPKSFAELGKDALVWLQYDKNDEWFVMMLPQSDRVVAWNRSSDRTFSFDAKGLDEPHLERDGRFVMICVERNWAMWDLQSGKLAGPYSKPFRGHPGAFRGLFAASDGSDNPAILWRHDPLVRANATIAVGEQIGNGGQHRADQWIMTDEELGGDLKKQWLLQTVHDEGAAKAGNWTLHKGNVFTAPVANWGSTYGKEGIGIRAIRQFEAGDPSRFAASLKEVESLAGVVEGSFYYDAKAKRSYAWIVGGGSPEGKAEVKAPALLHDGIALVRLDGSEIRLVAHHYSLDCEAQYKAMPKATISPDGKLVIFSSNMNDRDGRVDVFAAEIPTR